MKQLGILAIILILVSLILTSIMIKGCIVGEYEYEKKYLYLWNLSDKSSTLEEKEKYITVFANTLEKNRHDFSEYNAVWLKTPDNSFDYNLKAVQSLKDRLMEIKSMDPKSFEYQTAIQQITAQEQGEANKLLKTIEGCWVKYHYWYIWNWIGLVIGISAFILFCAGLICFGRLYDY